MAKTKKPKVPKSRGWNLMSKAADRASSKVATTALNTGWKAATGKTPPTDPHNPATSVVEAAVWSALRPAVEELSKVFAIRGAARYYEQSTGELPPPMRPEPVEPEPVLTRKQQKKLNKQKKKAK